MDTDYKLKCSEVVFSELSQYTNQDTSPESATLTLTADQVAKLSLVRKVLVDNRDCITSVELRQNPEITLIEPCADQVNEVFHDDELSAYMSGDSLMVSFKSTGKYSADNWVQLSAIDATELGTIIRHRRN